ncbi:MAG: hypothetical protein D6776_07825 [Planctomycetota bacterium]|nr:MAG: hypothetical protein D6776_07825 [Planctomycetota bacterium]
MTGARAHVAIAVAALLGALALGARAPAGETASGDAEPLRLRLLCVHDPTEQSEPWQGPIHEVLEAPAAHLGLRLEHLVLGGPLPGPEAMARYRGIVTWFADDSMPGAERYLRWLIAQLEHGRRALVIGPLGAGRDSRTGQEVDPALLAEAWAALGFERQPAWTDNPWLIRIRDARRPTIGWERALEGELRWFDGLAVRAPDAEVWLRLVRRDRPELACDAVAITAHGAYVAPTCAVWTDPAPPHGNQWRIDPWALLEASFRLEGLPRPDPTTCNGCRIAYAQIDGDGFDNRTLDPPHERAAARILERVLRPFAFPTTVGLITAPLDPASPHFAGADSVALARAILALPNVEPASHSHTHPFDWRTGRAAYAPEGTPFDPVAEVERSVRVLETRLCPPGRHVRAILWSGEANPPERAIAAASRLGLVNVGAGLTRIDAARRSRTWLRPLSRQVGAHWQVLDASANEIAFTDGWKRNFGGLRHVLETWRRTDLPRRTHPIALYYHFYSGEHPAGLASLEILSRWLAEHRDTLHPVWVSEYARTVEGFVHTRLERLADGGWRVLDRGALQTIRFDAPGRPVDLARSRGVLGFARERDTLYVHLDPAVAVAEIRFAPAVRPRPHIERATIAVRALERPREGAVAFEALAAPWGRVTLAGCAGTALYRVRVREGGRTIEDRALSTDRRGRLSLALRSPQRAWRAVSIEPARTGGPPR